MLFTRPAIRHKLEQVFEARQAEVLAEVVEIAYADLRQSLEGGVKTGDFNELKAALGATQGNLSVHLRKLEEAGHIAIDKSFVDRKPLTRARITESGRAAFAAYLEAISKLLGERPA